MPPDSDPLRSVISIPLGPESLLLSLEVAAGVLSVSVSTVLCLIENGELTACRIGDELRITSADLNAYIDRVRVVKKSPQQF